MELLLRKYLWAIDLAVIAVCAVFAARATAGVVESAYFSGGAPVRAAARSRPPISAPHYTKDTTVIIDRNVFCSTCPPIRPKPSTEVPEPPSAPTPERTSMPIKLMAVMFSPPPHDPRWSMAIIRDNENMGTAPYAVGSRCREAVVTDIQETRVYFELGGRPEYIDLLDAKPGAPSPGPQPPALGASRAGGGDALSIEMDRGIKKLGEHNYEVQRSTLDQVLGNMSVLSRSARIVPEVKDGKPAGFRLYSVRPDGPFAKIGLQNGDVISAINGLEMTSPDKALEVYTKLKSAGHLSVGLERNGQKISKEYTIR